MIMQQQRVEYTAKLGNRFSVSIKGETITSVKTAAFCFWLVNVYKISKRVNRVH